MEKNIIMRHMSRTTFQEESLRFCYSCIQHSTSKLEMQQKNQNSIFLEELHKQCQDFIGTNFVNNPQ